MGLRSLVAKLLHKSDSKKNDNWVETAAVREIKPFTLGRMRRNFKATVADEVSMKKGSEVKALYREDEWLYVHGSDGKRGFVPQTYCTLTMDRRQGNGQRPSRTPSKILRRISLKETERQTANTMNRYLLEDLNKSSLQRFLDSLPVTKEAGLPFNIEEIGKATVRRHYFATRKSDVSVRRGEEVSVLNIDDLDWTFVRTRYGREGFVPANYLDSSFSNTMARRMSSESQHLLVIEDFYGQHDMDISVKEGEWIRVISSQKDGWMWVRRLRNGKEGFLPSRVAILATNV